MTNVGALFEEMGGKAMPQGMRRDALRDARQALGGVDGALELTGGTGLIGFSPGKSQPVPRQSG